MNPGRGARPEAPRFHRRVGAADAYRQRCVARPTEHRTPGLQHFDLGPAPARTVLLLDPLAKRRLRMLLARGLEPFLVKIEEAVHVAGLAQGQMAETQAQVG